MTYSSDDLLKLIFDTRALSIWNQDKGPVFWYTANVPGPFYLNTEMMIGGDVSEKMMREITAIIAGTVDAQARAEQLKKAIMTAYKASPAWQKLIATMIGHAREEFGKDGFALISGGERRDWLFSIPFAHDCELPHLYLFKNKTSYCEHPVKAGQKTLHVSDLINNAASYFELWDPALRALNLPCAGNLCVCVRGESGLKRLREAKVKTSWLLTIDVEFFRRLHAANIISRAVFEELAVFFGSDKDWAQKYLLGKPELFNVSGCDAKSFERLKIFVEKDPWHMRSTNEAFFTSMGAAIKARESKAA